MCLVDAKLCYSRTQRCAFYKIDTFIIINRIILMYQQFQKLSVSLRITFFS